MSRATDILRERADKWFVAERGSLATREELHAVADLMAECDGAAYCVSCGIRQCTDDHTDDHHDGCKRAALERLIEGDRDVDR